jgi:hypothetical protein
LRPDGLVGLLCALLCIVHLPTAGAATHVPMATAVTGETLDGELVGSSPFTLPGSVDPVTGRVLIRAALSHGQAPQALVEFTPAGPAMAVLAAAGDPAVPGLTFASFLAPQSCAGRTAFWAGLGEEPEPQVIVKSGIFRRIPGQTSSIALTGDPAPDGGTFTALGSSPRVDLNDRMILLAATSISQDDLILLQHSSTGTLSHLLEVGDTDGTGSTVLEILDADLSCAGQALALVTLDTPSGPLRALLAQGQSGWDALMTQGDTLPDQTEIDLILLPAAFTQDLAIHVVVERKAGAGPAMARIGVDLSSSLLATAGDPTPVGSAITGFGPPVPLDGERVAFRVTLADGSGLPAAAEPHAIMAAGPAFPAAVLLAAGATSPGAGILLDLGHPAGALDGSLHLSARAAGEQTMDGLLHWTGTVEWTAPAGSTLPGWGRFLGGGFRSAQPAIEASGRTAFLANLPADGEDTALFIASAGQPPGRLLAAADNLLGGGTITRLNGPPEMASGVVWIAAEVEEPMFRQGYVRATEGSMPVLELAEGDPAPSGGTFRTLGRVLAADQSGRLFFSATLAGGTSSSGVFAMTAGTPAPIALSGTVAPGGGTFSAFGFSPAATGSGTAFLAYTGGTVTGNGIFHAHLGGPAPVVGAVARTGEGAPGGGSYFSFQDPVAGEDGSIAFTALLDSGTVGLYVHDVAGTRRLLATGETLADGAEVADFVDIAMADTGLVYASLQVENAAASTRVVVLDGGSAVTMITGGAMVPLANGQEASLDSVPSLSAGGTDHLVMAAELAGWSTGAAVVQAGLDADGDGRGDPVDCSPADDQAWTLPAVVGDLRVLLPYDGGATAPLTWTSLAQAAGPGTTHEVMAGTIQSLRLQAGLAGAGCAAAGIPDGLALVTDSVPAPGEAFWYLVRGRNGCGAGNLATASVSRIVPGGVCATP